MGYMSYNEYQREYQLNRYHARRNQALEFLGGKCVVCGGTDQLEIDHIDPTTKEIDIAKLWGVSKARFWKEISKCQLLCNTHHIDKTLTEGDAGKFHARHGTYYMYRRYKCRCEECKAAERAQRKKW